MSVVRFPDEFLIGASTAAHQIEGNNVNSNWWALENRPGSPLPEPSGDAADSYHRWREDLDIVRDVGLDAYRFSIEWARIEPTPGRFSAAALAHYARMIDGALERGIEPVVTLHHFTDPLWFAKQGGWGSPTAAERFVAYVEVVAPLLRSVRHVVTINEPNMVACALQAFGQGSGDPVAEPVPGAPLPPPSRSVVNGLTESHHAARRRLRELLPDTLVGWSIANQAVQYVPGGEEHAANYREYVEDLFLRECVDDDFVGVQAYTRNIFGPDGPVRDDPESERTLMGWEYWPDAAEEAVRHTADVTGGVPILVTENGIATADDERRISYTRDALAGVHRAMTDGIDVRGYLHWSLLDNYEWGSYRPTFGLVEWDPETFERHPKPSAQWLGDLARTRVLPQART